MCAWLEPSHRLCWHNWTCQLLPIQIADWYFLWYCPMSIRMVVTSSFTTLPLTKRTSSYTLVVAHSSDSIFYSRPPTGCIWNFGFISLSFNLTCSPLGSMNSLFLHSFPAGEFAVLLSRRRQQDNDQRFWLVQNGRLWYHGNGVRDSRLCR